MADNRVATFVVGSHFFVFFAHYFRFALRAYGDFFKRFSNITVVDFFTVVTGGHNSGFVRDQRQKSRRFLLQEHRYQHLL